MRANVYKALVEKLKQYTDAEGNQVFKHFDLWNEQVDFVEDETPFGTPAVFVEFKEISWGNTSQYVQQASFVIRLHVVTEWQGSESDGSRYQEQALKRLEIVDGLASHLYNWVHRDDGVKIQQMQRSASYTNHNHGELIEDIEDFTCRVLHFLK